MYNVISVWLVKTRFYLLCFCAQFRVDTNWLVCSGTDVDVMHKTTVNGFHNSSAAVDCTPSPTNAAAAAACSEVSGKELLNPKLSTGGNASSAPGPNVRSSSSPDVEAMREWW